MADKLDVMEYAFGVTQIEGEDGVTEDRIAEGGTFEGVFKENEDENALLEQTRAARTGLQNGQLNLAGRNIATYELAKLFDSSIIPPTFAAMQEENGEEIVGSVMEKIDGVTGYGEFDNPDYDSSWEEIDGMGDAQFNPKQKKVRAYQLFQNDPVYKQGVSKLMMLDFIAGQVDRHPGNYMIELQDGVVIGVKGIDNDLSFGDEITDLTYSSSQDKEEGRDRSEMSPGLFETYISAAGAVQALEGFDRTMAQRIVEVANDPQMVEDALDGLITDDEIAAAISRLQSFADFLQPMLADDDERIISEWS